MEMPQKKKRAFSQNDFPVSFFPAQRNRVESYPTTSKRNVTGYSYPPVKLASVSLIAQLVSDSASTLKFEDFYTSPTKIRQDMEHRIHSSSVPLPSNHATSPKTSRSPKNRFASKQSETSAISPSSSTNKHRISSDELSTTSEKHSSSQYLTSFSHLKELKETTREMDLIKEETLSIASSSVLPEDISQTTSVKPLLSKPKHFEPKSPRQRTRNEIDEISSKSEYNFHTPSKPSTAPTVIYSPQWVSRDLIKSNEEKYKNVKENVFRLRDLAKKEREELEKLKYPPVTTKRREYGYPDRDQWRIAEEKVKIGSFDEVLYDQGATGQCILRKDLRTLLGTEWLNDIVVNGYMFMILQRSKQYHSEMALNDSPDETDSTLSQSHSACSQSSRWPKIHIFTSYFLQNLGNNGYDYNGVRRWSRKAKVDIFAMDKIILPVHLGNHWCLAVINFQTKRFEYYDSLGNSNEACISILKRYLQDEWKDKKYSEDKSLPETYNLAGWKTFFAKDIPHQMNGYDCGVFACTYADYASRNKPFDFAQADMPAIRAHMLVRLISGNPLPIE